MLVMPSRRLHVWNRAPAIRLLLPLVAGIVAQWYLSFTLPVLITTTIALAVVLLVFTLLPLHQQFSLKSFWGMTLMLLIAALGAWLVRWQDVRHNENWMGHQKESYNWVEVTLQEPVVEKQASYKVLATVNAAGKNGVCCQASGKVILYLQKDSIFSNLTYGARLLITRDLQPIKNSGNPGSFNYQRYALFQGITHQAYVTGKDVIQLPQNGQKDLKTFLFHTRAWVIATLQHYIKGERESGLAEALLIGYKDDLDKTLVQAYVNTGVVHVIAISGLHLGIIYFLLLAITKPLSGKKLAFLRVGFIITALWAFTLLAGAQASVVRSAVMFTAIALGGLLNRKAFIYNTLALSALLLLLYNPFWLWDAGFQLSYAAVLSIIIFYKPIYNWAYFKNKIIDAVWKLMAVTLAAQLLTLPVSLYHFHQFPLLFFLTNLVAVPLSSAILIGEIFLCAFSFFPPIAQVAGNWLHHLIYWMNNYIQQMSAVPFASWQNISISFWQALLLMVVITSIAYWLLQKEKSGAILASINLLLFLALRTFSFWQAEHQKKIIVYNIPKQQAIDLIDGRNFMFISNEEVEQNGNIYNYHLAPSRIQHRVQPSGKMFQKAFTFGGQKVLIVDSSLNVRTTSKPLIHLLILSKNPKLYMRQLHQAFTLQQVVIDASVPAWKAALWQRDCDSLKINCYNVAQKGAFVMNL